MVSVSRRAGLPQRGQVVSTKLWLRDSGFPSRPVNSTSYGSSTGSWSSGAGTVAQASRAPRAAGDLRVVRELDRELVLGDGHGAACLAVDDRDRRAPVALARDEPVAEPVGHLATADPLLLQPGDDAADGLRAALQA